ANGGKPGICLLDLATRTSLRLSDDPSEGLFSPPGWLVSVRNEQLMAQALDWQAGRLTGDAGPLSARVEFAGGRCTGLCTGAAEGTLVYRPATGLLQLQEFDIEGHLLRPLGDPAPIVSIFVSPDGTRLAETRKRENAQLDLWVVDTQRGLGSPLTEDIESPIV